MKRLRRPKTRENRVEVLQQRDLDAAAVARSGRIKPQRRRAAALGGVVVVSKIGISRETWLAANRPDKPRLSPLVKERF
jgi:hypothetical protein